MVKAFPPDCDLVLADRMDLALATPCSHLTCGLPMLARVPVLPLVVLSLPPPESLVFWNPGAALHSQPQTVLMIKEGGADVVITGTSMNVRIPINNPLTPNHAPHARFHADIACVTKPSAAKRIYCFAIPARTGQ